MRVRAYIVSIVLLLLVPGVATAQGTWFDIGVPQSATVYCASDSESWIYYPSYPFGTNWPPGTLVYSELALMSNANFSIVYYAYFNDGGCGCGAAVSNPITYRLHYDEALVTWPESATALFIYQNNSWVQLPDAVLDVSANTITLVITGLVRSYYLAIGPDALVPVESSTWGRIKSLCEN